MLPCKHEDLSSNPQAQLKSLLWPQAPVSTAHERWERRTAGFVAAKPALSQENKADGDRKDSGFHTGYNVHTHSQMKHSAPGVKIYFFSL